MCILLKITKNLVNLSMCTTLQIELTQIYSGESRKKLKSLGVNRYYVHFASIYTQMSAFCEISLHFTP